MLTTIFTILFVLIIILIAVGGGIFVWIYWWMIQRPLPEWNGRVTLPGLDAEVEILRDKHGVPHIYAQNRADLFRAQGYVHAQDRLWQMEQNRRVARGTLSAVVGEAALEADRFSRVIGFWRMAQAEFESIDDETRQVLDWYAQGVNAYMAERPGRLAAEFNLLRFTPEPWTALDTVAWSKVMGWSLSINWESELIRLQLSHQLGPYRAAELEPDYPEQNPNVLDALGEERAQRLLSTAGLLLNQYEAVKTWLESQGAQPFGVGQGSNSWAIAPKASQSGYPLLANDPHLALTMPSTFYENHLHCPDLHVSGASFAGAPGVVIGHNERIAWGVTNGFVDVQDLYVERPHPEDDTLFEFQGEWEQAQVIEEVIEVRRGQPHTERVIITRHGPLISELLENEHVPKLDGQPELKTIPLALRWSGQEPGNLVRSLLRINEASNWEEFDCALADWSIPPSNITYADVDGYVGYVMAGRIPVRGNHPGVLPAPGWSGEHEWQGWIPHAELPRVFNPESGKIVTANNKMVGDDYPYFLGVEFYPGWRAARLEEVLKSRPRYTLRQMQELQLDTTSKYAAALTPWLTELEASGIWQRMAIGALRDWNYRMEVDSTAATVFHFTLLQLLQKTFGEKLGPLMPGYLGMAMNPLFTVTGFFMRAESHLLKLLETQEESAWYTDAETGRTRTRDELLQESFDEAVRILCDDVGETMTRWQWGRHHQVRYVHPLGSVPLLRGFFNRGPYPVGGDASSPFQTRHMPQMPLELVRVVPAYRQVYELGNWDSAQTIMSSGQSGHPLSRQYADQIDMWREGDYHPMPWTRAAVEEIAEYRLALTNQE